MPAAEASSLDLVPAPLREEPVLGAPIDAAHYRLGPGDVLVLAVPRVISGETLVVDAEGGLVLPGSAGRVEVAGLTLEAARRRVGEALATLVRERTFVLSLRAPRRFKVYVVGQVARPGAYPASPVTRVSEVIERAGGILSAGSQRNVTVQRADTLVIRADLVAFGALGDLDKNPSLEGGDVVRVPVRIEEVGIFGGVASPGIYEFVAGETVESAIALAGGLIPGAERERAWVSHSVSGGRTVESASSPTLALAAGDALVVPATGEPSAIHHAEVTGEVLYPGIYPIRPGVDTVALVLERAGGLTPAANPAGARLLRPAPRVPRLDIGNDAGVEPGAPAAAGGTPGSDSRAVAPGGAPEPPPPPAFAELPRTAREVELLKRSEESQEVRVAWIENPLRDGTALADGDHIDVPRATGKVRVGGRVRAPGWVDFTAGRPVDHYVSLAGGYDRHADRSQILVQRAGRPTQVERARGSKPLLDGDTIWVPEKSPRSRWAIVKETIAVVAEVATVVIVVDQFAK